jgi:hypothetical protein
MCNPSTAPVEDVRTFINCADVDNDDRLIRPNMRNTVSIEVINTIWLIQAVIG